MFFLKKKKSSCLGHVQGSIRGLPLFCRHSTPRLMWVLAATDHQFSEAKIQEVPSYNYCGHNNLPGAVTVNPCLADLPCCNDYYPPPSLLD